VLPARIVASILRYLGCAYRHAVAAMATKGKGGTRTRRRQMGERVAHTRETAA
jgi:hypothetical protein